MFIGDYLGRRAVYSPDGLAVVDAGKEPEWRLSYAQMNDRANRLANWLQNEAGVVVGDRVAILARDGVEHLDLFFACAKLGAIHTALNWRLHWRELAGICADCGPKVLIYSGEFCAAVEKLRSDPRANSVGSALYLDGTGCEGDALFEQALSNASDAAVVNDTVDEETVAALIFTGGTTGLPKAAQVTHRMIAWNTLNTVIHDLQHGDIYLNVFPMFHTGGLFVYTLPQIILGGTTILVREFDPQRILSLLERERATVFAAVPAMYQLLAQAANWEDVDLSSLRFCTSGGAPLPVPLVERYTAEKGIRFKQGFGMTEFGPGVFALAAEDAIRKAGSIGRPNFYVDARVVNDDNKPLGANQVGELLLKGPSAASGYFNNFSFLKIFKGPGNTLSGRTNKCSKIHVCKRHGKILFFKDFSSKIDNCICKPAIDLLLLLIYKSAVINQFFMTNICKYFRSKLTTFLNQLLENPNIDITGPDILQSSS